jgi:hypothetical protein
MTIAQTLAKVNTLLKTYDTVEVWVWDKVPETKRMLAGDTLADQLSKLSKSEEVLGITGSSLHNDPVSVPLTNDPEGLRVFKDCVAVVKERQDKLRKKFGR